MTAAPTRVRAVSEVALDSTAFALFGLFVVLLVFGYLGALSSIPYAALAALCLLGALAVLFAANWRVDRRAPGPNSPIAN